MRNLLSNMTVSSACSDYSPSLEVFARLLPLSLFLAGLSPYPDMLLT